MKPSFQQECAHAPDWATHGLIGRDIQWLAFLGVDANGVPVYRDSQGLLIASNVAQKILPLSDDPRLDDPSLA